MGILRGLTKVALSPLRGIKEIGEDLSGNNDSPAGGLSAATFGASSIVKGTFKGIVEGVDEIFND